MSVDWCNRDSRQNGSPRLGDPRSDHGVLGRHTDAHARVLRVGAMADPMTSEVRAGSLVSDGIWLLALFLKDAGVR